MHSPSTDYLRDPDTNLLSALRRAAKAEARFLALHPYEDTWDLVAAEDARNPTEHIEWEFVSRQDTLAEAGELGGVDCSE